MRITRSLELDTMSLPEAVNRRNIMTPLQSRVECIILHDSVSMIFSHPLLVPAMIWFPSEVKIVMQVDCLASCAACFSLTSSSFIWCRLGAEGNWRLAGIVDEMSTSIG